MGASEAEVVAVAPVASVGGIEFTPLGLTNMLNCGGAITKVVYRTGKGDSVKVENEGVINW